MITKCKKLCSVKHIRAFTLQTFAKFSGAQILFRNSYSTMVAASAQLLYSNNRQKLATINHHHVSIMLHLYFYMCSRVQWFWLFSHFEVRGEIQMIPESAYKLSASKNWEILWKNKLKIWPFSIDLLFVPPLPGRCVISCLVC